MNIDAINTEIQRRLKLGGGQFVTAVEAAVWLDEKELLKDSVDRPGKPLRQLLRQNLIVGQRQESNSRWFIDQQS